MSNTLSGATLGLVESLPATYDETGYAALTYDNGTCALKSVPELSRTWATVDDAVVCRRTTYQKKGTATWVAISFQLNIETGDSAQDTYRDLEADDDSASFALTFQTGDIAYFTAQVSQFSITDGGEGDTINMGTVTLLPQSDIVFVAAD